MGFLTCVNDGHQAVWHGRFVLILKQAKYKKYEVSPNSSKGKQVPADR